ncbi:diguanylate cyclase (GGDEF)-like protein [Pseudoxanthomonas broegbernensis]|uniref:ligand-binding sensor domain-containing diguanylate cyclase n=1 Tax=Pseudoxanthomonas broegbernensis TaxID=83619 RepID=UPI00161CEC13|nr:ligand-binding sensor domain-containing diguanylate cyclase [Pseudoxanthomonas broegbernensis]MBB6066386.1 diguanylate cyclase (GGDEF)-like protein [Pseudoxanthomonas broegbernensis]
MAARACARLLLASWAAVALPAVALDADKPFRDYVSDTWGVEQGLPQISVLSIAQDPSGYLWFGTQGGLARFDGTRFFRYTQHDADALGSHVQALRADPGGRLWIGTSQGLLVLEQGRFRTLDPARAPDGPSGTFSVAALALDGDGRMLVGGPDGVYVAEGDRLAPLHALSGPALSLLPREDGLWIGGIGQVLRTEADGLHPLPLPTAARGAQVTALVETADGIWAGTSQGLFHLRDGAWRRLGGGEREAAAPVEALCADRDGNLWVATSGQLKRIRDGRIAERIEDAPAGNAIRALFEDRNGNLWLGSMIGGVTRLWDGWTRRLSVPEGLGNPVLWAIAGAPDGEIWVGGSDGVDAWSGGHFQRRVPGARLPHPEAYSLLAEADRTWIGTRAGAAVLRHGRVETPAALAPMRSAQINGIVRDRARRLWFATTQGLFMLPPGGGSPVHYTTQDGLGDVRVRLVHETGNGRILLGTYRGLYEWRDGRILPLGRQTGLIDDTMISAILELEDGRWVVGSTTGEDLRVFDGRRWHQIGRAQDLPTNVAFFLAQASGQLWVAGMRGIYRLPLEELDRAIADPGHRVAATMVINSGSDRPGGQQDKCCNGAGNSRGLLRDGRLWLPTRDGALLVDTAPAPAHVVEPAVQIERVQALGSWLLPDAGAPMALPVDARELKFEFTVPVFRPTHTPQLRYRLAGYEQAWHELDNPAMRMAAYSHLPPGRYTFEVADFSRAKPMASAARLELEIPPRLHETLVFRLLLLTLLGGIPYLGYLWLQRRHARQRTELELLVQERTRDLQAVNARLEAISFTDPLTGLHNRRYLSRQIPADLSFYERDAGYRDGTDALVFVLLDLDHFKSINDTHGHAAGDRVLEQLADVLGGLVRRGDYVARWGGEEFLLVFRPLPRGQLAQIGQRLCEQIANHDFDLGNGMCHRLTASIGLIECPLFPESPRLLGWEQLVTLADRALYRAKASGRNTWFAYRPIPGARPPSGMLAFEGDPWWLVDAGLLEMYGEDGPAAKE